jgi:hypothetical protein
MTGQLDVCRYLVEEKGFDANSTSTEGKSPAPARLFSVRDEHGRRPEPRAERLPLRPSTCRRDAIFVATDTDSRLLNGAENGVVPLLTYFLGCGGDPAAPDAKGCTPLHNAAQYGSFISLPFNLCDFLGLIS